MATNICKRCDTPLLANSMQCRACKLFNIEGHSATTLTQTGDDGTILLSEVKSAEEQRINAGIFNYVWSGFPEKGVVRTSVTLVGGLPGAGKTTMLLQILNMFAESTKLETGFIAAEMIPEEIRMYADRLQLKFMNRIRMIPAMTGTVDVGAVLSKYKFGAVVLDSLQGLVGDDDNASISVCTICKQRATELKFPIMIVSHVTKEGDYAGLMKLQHAVDTLMLVSPDEETGIRTVEILKNRFGKAHIHSEFDMTEHGLVLHTEKDDEYDDDDDSDDRDSD